MIPNTIHYIWLGNTENMPPLCEKCIESWHRYLPHFNFVFWREEEIRKHFNANEISFFNKMLEKKKYAFAADFARCIILDKFGGVYLDTDVEIIKDITPLLEGCTTFLGVEDINKPNCAILGATKDNFFLKRLIEFIIKADGLIEIPILAYKALVSISPNFTYLEGFTSYHDIIVYPNKYFYPYNPYRNDSVGQLLYSDVTTETYAIHHWAKTWKLSIFERLKKFFN